MKTKAMTIMLGGKSMSEDSSKISFIDAYAVVLNRECELIAFRVTEISISGANTLESRIESAAFLTKLTRI